MDQKQAIDNLNLLVDCHVFDGKHQGTRTYLQGLYSCMIKHDDIDFYFAAKDVENIMRVFGAASNVHYVRLSSKGGKFYRLTVEFPQIIRNLGIDYAHFQYISPLIKRCKEIVTLHDLLFLDFPQYFPLPYRIKNKVLFELSARRADVLLTVSEYSKTAIASHLNINKERIYVTPNAVLPVSKDLTLPDVRSKWGIERYVLTVGRIEPRKNFLLLLKAFVELRLFDDGYKLMVIGAPDLQYKEFYDYYAQLPSTIKRCVIMDRATFPELVALYKNARLFVFPSLAEGFGIPLLEAVEYGCPLLCSNTTAMSEFGLSDELLFNPNDLEELKTKMKAALSKPQNMDKEKMKEKYSWKKSADTFYDILTKGLHTNTGGGNFRVLTLPTGRRNNESLSAA